MRDHRKSARDENFSAMPVQGVIVTGMTAWGTVNPYWTKVQYTSFQLFAKKLLLEILTSHENHCLS